MSYLDLEAFLQAPMATEPFQYSITQGFIRPATAQLVRADFPEIEHSGLLPVEATQPGPHFRALISELTGPAVTAAFSRKFGLDLTGRPTMVTLRGRCAEKDGRIHTDSEAKLVTALLYFNESWEAQGGRLRLLRGPDDINDAIAEVPPDLGTLVAFRRSEKSFHGHEPFVGVRRYVMINWMASGLAAQRELMRHKISAQAKKMMHYA
ncbi:2OG-Fe(II) oxygenase [Acidocella sp. KAb 2-4]|uniref:2OG-Fe(II) oxygenase family protein n=1 Tax=Acidocella sp. KAb 2-4 TaxID=2885158 RepID=UPI001D09312E|nr:2OG-Fe(II) oxygenase [Acidocella sp. KAb 2-4]MCB5943916.1 2OG-Fe(II) oxygenase [Acidocella sp. KAb 2-4]